MKRDLTKIKNWSIDCVDGLVHFGSVLDY